MESHFPFESLPQFSHNLPFQLTFSRISTHVRINRFRMSQGQCALPRLPFLFLPSPFQLMRPSSVHLHASNPGHRKFSHPPAGFRSHLTPLFLHIVARFVFLQYKLRHRPPPEFTHPDALWFIYPAVLLNVIPQAEDQSPNP